MYHIRQLIKMIPIQLSHNSHLLHNLLSPPPTFPRHPVKVAPPSISTAFPVICALALLLKKSTSPPKSLGLPILPVGCPDVNASAYFSKPKFVIRLGKTPGQMTLTMIFLGASFEACILVRWMHAAFAGPSVHTVRAANKETLEETTYN